jgi:hypothetical protein
MRFWFQREELGPERPPNGHPIANGWARASAGLRNAARGGLIRVASPPIRGIVCTFAVIARGIPPRAL